jgi:hypothetical protein
MAKDLRSMTERADRQQARADSQQDLVDLQQERALIQQGRIDTSLRRNEPTSAIVCKRRRTHFEMGSDRSSVASGRLPGKAPPAEVAQYGQDNDDDDDDPNPGSHADVSSSLG